MFALVLMICGIDVPDDDGVRHQHAHQQRHPSLHHLPDQFSPVPVELALASKHFLEEKLFLNFSLLLKLKNN